jgi:hypothetical protein
VGPKNICTTLSATTKAPTRITLRMRNGAGEFHDHKTVFTPDYDSRVQHHLIAMGASRLLRAFFLAIHTVIYRSF